MIFAPLVLSVLAQAPAPQAELRAVHERALRDGRALEHVQELTDTVGPRLAGSRGDALAVQWALRKMKALGFENVRAEKVKVPHWERLSESAELVAPVRQPLVVTALGGSRSTPAGGIEAEVLMAESVEALEALPAERVKGKIVFLNKKMRRDPSGAGYGETVGIRSNGMLAAAASGAVAVVIRSVGTGEARFAHTGMIRRDPTKREIPAAALALSDAELIERLLARGPVRLRLSVKTKWHPDAVSANVVGEIPGRGALAERFIVLGAHLDSWDVGQGAVDNASGVGAVLEAGRLLAQDRSRAPRRTLRVVLFANEENGGKGGTAYAADHATELARHDAAVVSDFGAGRPRGLLFQSTQAGTPQLEALAEVLGVDEVTHRYLGHPDVSPLMQQGVPLVAIAQDAARYFDLHHTHNDTFDKIVPDEYRAFVSALTVVAHHLVTAQDPLPRVPEGERAPPKK